MTTDDCCLDKACVVEQLREGQATNPAPGAGGERHDVCRRGCLWLAGSVALLADSLDMLGDDMVYGFSLYIVSRGPIWKARAAVAKALVYLPKTHHAGTENTEVAQRKIRNTIFRRVRTLLTEN